jgi:putative Mg2+ transporter-C (MgtC) family protein
MEINVTCRAADEAHLRTLLLAMITQSKAVLQSIDSEDIEGTDRNRIRTEIIAAGTHNEAVEQLVTRLSFEPGVSAVSWSLFPAMVE